MIYVKYIKGEQNYNHYPNILYIPKQCQPNVCNPFIQKWKMSYKLILFIFSAFIHRMFWAYTQYPFSKNRQTLNTTNFSLFWIYWIIMWSICRALLLLSLNWTNVDVTSTSFITRAEKNGDRIRYFALTEFGKMKIVIYIFFFLSPIFEYSVPVRDVHWLVMTFKSWKKPGASYIIATWDHYSNNVSSFHSILFMIKLFYSFISL